MKKAVILVLALAVLGGFFFWTYSSNLFSQNKPQGPVVLTVWGVEDDESIWRPIIANYQTSHPNVQITYLKQSLLNYRTRVQTQIRAGQGPDIFSLHSSWLPMFSGELSAAPSSVISFSDFGKSFYPIFKETLTSGNKIYAMPTEFNGLALFYNEDILKAAGVAVPQSWQDFVNTARQVTVKNQQGQIQTAGAAMGTTTNVDFWPEIIAMLFLQQPSANLASPASKNGGEALLFYTSFITDPKNKTWDVNLASSTQMFEGGKLAFYFAPATQAQVLKTANPTLNFKVAPVPQLPGGNMAVGGFWAEAVSGRSTKQQEAWEFLTYLSSAQTLQFLNQQRADMGASILPYPRIDLAGISAPDPVLGAFNTQASYSKGWYLNSGIQDAGLNEEMVKIYEGIVNGVLQGQDPQGVLQGAASNIQQTMAKYGLSSK